MVELLTGLPNFEESGGAWSDDDDLEKAISESLKTVKETQVHLKKAAFQEEEELAEALKLSQISALKDSHQKVTYLSCYPTQPYLRS